MPTAWGPRHGQTNHSRHIDARTYHHVESGVCLLERVAEGAAAESDRATESDHYAAVPALIFRVFARAFYLRPSINRASVRTALSRRAEHPELPWYGGDCHACILLADHQSRSAHKTARTASSSPR
jgi:hypothetical protein